MFLAKSAARTFWDHMYFTSRGDPVNQSISKGLL